MSPEFRIFTHYLRTTARLNRVRTSPEESGMLTFIYFLPTKTSPERVRNESGTNLKSFLPIAVRIKSSHFHPLFTNNRACEPSPDESRGLEISIFIIHLPTKASPERVQSDMESFFSNTFHNQKLRSSPIITNG